jgi:hypothetical protein
MVDREKVVAVLKKRFEGARVDQIAAAANAIVGLDEEWEEVSDADVSHCSESCFLSEITEGSARVKVFRKRPVD